MGSLREKENTLGWIVVTTYLYDKATPKELEEKTGIKRVRTYLSELVKVGLLERKDRGLYTIQEKAFIEKILQLFYENNIELSENEKELLKSLLFSPFIKEIQKTQLPNVKQVLSLNPYKYLLYLLYSIIKVYFYAPLVKFGSRLIEEGLKEIKKENPELVNKIKEKFKDKNQAIFIAVEYLGREGVPVLAEKLIPDSPEFATVKGLLKKYSIEFVSILQLINFNLDLLNNLLSKIKIVLSKEPAFLILLNTIDIGVELGYSIADLWAFEKGLAIKTEMKEVAKSILEEVLKKENEKEKEETKNEKQ